MPENVAIQGFKNHFSNLKLDPIVNIEFDTLNSDIYQEIEFQDKDPLTKAKSKEPELLDFYMKKAKERLIQSVKNLNKVQKKRNKKEQRKKFVELHEYGVQNDIMSK